MPTKGALDGQGGGALDGQGVTLDANANNKCQQKKEKECNE